MDDELPTDEDISSEEKVNKYFVKNIFYGIKL